MFHPGLGFGVLSSYLREKGLEVSMYDLNTILSRKFGQHEIKSKFEIFFDKKTVFDYLNGESNREADDVLARLLEDIDVDRFDSYGISVGADYSFLQIHAGFMLGKYLENNYGKPVLFGGNNISLIYIFRDMFNDLWQVILKNFCYIIKGAGERTILDIISALNENLDDSTINKINGLVRLSGKDVTVNQEYKPLILRPDWDGMDLTYYYRYMFDDSGNDEKARKATADNLVYFFKWPGGFPGSPGQMVNKYNKLRGKNIRPRIIIPYIFNYNCPFTCAFCTQSDFDRGSVVGGEPGKVFEDVVALIDKYDTNYFNFVNNSFNFSIDFVDNFCHRVISEGVKFYWSDCGRFNNLTYERLRLMKEAGCVKLTFGLETASEKMLALIDKRLNLAHSEQVLQWCHELGIWADLEIIIGLPQEFDRDFEDTCRYIEKNYDYINYFWINEYFVVPNSLIGRFPEKYGIKLIRDHKTYQGLLQENMKYFRMGELSLTHNAKLYGFNEIEGRIYDTILKDNKRHITDLNRLQRHEFAEASKLFNMLSEKGA
jgi:radical SAM superfamily enzyme YgiQ (UPF0313 family)